MATDVTIGVAAEVTVAGYGLDVHAVETASEPVRARLKATVGARRLVLGSEADVELIDRSLVEDCVEVLVRVQRTKRTDEEDEPEDRVVDRLGPELEGRVAEALDCEAVHGYELYGPYVDSMRADAENRSSTR